MKLPQITVRVAVSRQLVIESAEFKNVKEESESSKRYKIVQNNHVQSFVKQVD